MDRPCLLPLVFSFCLCQRKHNRRIVFSLCLCLALSCIMLPIFHQPLQLLPCLVILTTNTIYLSIYIISHILNEKKNSFSNPPSPPRSTSLSHTHSLSRARSLSAYAVCVHVCTQDVRKMHRVSRKPTRRILSAMGNLTTNNI